jgi:hypothetical protein
MPTDSSHTINYDVDRVRLILSARENGSVFGYCVALRESEAGLTKR